MNNKVDYDLTCWYLNLRRVIELVGPDALQQYKSLQSFADISSDNFAALALLARSKDAIVDWLKDYRPPSLGQLLISQAVVPGKMFTHYSNFFCKGLAALRNKTGVLAEMYSKLDDIAPGQRLSIHYDPAHLTSGSAWSTLTGQVPLFVLAAIKSEANGVIEAIPYIIATPLPGLGEGTVKGNRWGTRLEIYIENIDSFALAKTEPRPDATDLALLKNIPEADVKQAFAEILEEQTIPNDWGGERSDLFGSVIIDGQRTSAAFAFKGPAKFKPMTMAELGKNGDQIDRLFSEPADLIVLQHCHQITPAVRGMMRAYATRIQDLRLFTLVDGFDTLRVLRAYSKCGFAPTASR